MSKIRLELEKQSSVRVEEIGIGIAKRIDKIRHEWA